MKIYLIGMPGSGKTTVGKALAQDLGYDFLDLDSYIEQKSFLFIDEIFQMYGEKYFRDLESNCLAEFLNSDNIVVSCGGGVVCKKTNKDLMNGKVILLNTSLETIAERIKDDDNIRPLLAKKSLQDMATERANLYFDFAEVCYQNDSTIPELVAKIREEL